MKKTLLIVSALSMGVSVWAQHANTGSAQLPSAVANRKAAFHKATEMEFSSLYSYQTQNGRAGHTPSVAVAETVIGTTNYPLQTNSSMHPRLVYNSDGTISATWTYSNGAWNTWADRGTGYNFYDGSNWGSIPTTRLESDRTGFTNIQVLGNGGEVTVAHNTNLLRQHFMMRAGHGTGTWTDYTNLINPPSSFTYGTWWPQMAVGGNSGDVIHHISLTAPTGLASGGGPYTNGQDGAILYSRSMDNGQSFTLQNMVLAAFDSTHSVGYGGDSYVMDAKGSEVAIVAGGFGEDVMLAKSMDNGTTWTMDTIHDFPITLFSDAMLSDTNNDGLADTLQTNDGSLAVLIDNNGLVHCWYGNMRIIEDDLNTAGISYFPGTTGIMYWNENMVAPVQIADVVDSLNDGTLQIADFGTYQVSLTSHPSAGIDASGTMYVAYDAAVDMSDDGNGKAYRNVYIIASTDGGATWTQPYNVANDPFYEKVYPSIARNVDTKARVIYQRDDRPGHGINVTADSDNSGVVCDIIYAEVPTSAILSSVAEQPKNVSSVTVYPNPANTFTSVAITLQHADEATVTVYNTMGQKVSSFSSNLPAGTNKLDINTQNYGKGVYFVNVLSAGSQTTEKLIIE